MTKEVRIENADTSDYKVLVQVWDKTVGDGPDVLVEEKELTHPTQLGEFMIFGGRYLVVKEVE